MERKKTSDSLSVLTQFSNWAYSIALAGWIVFFIAVTLNNLSLRVCIDKAVVLADVKECNK